MTNRKHIILFDGICNLCNNSIRFISKRDGERIFTYIPLQSEEGRNLLTKFNTTPEKNNSIVYIYNGTIFLKSTAVLKILYELNGFWKLLYAFIIIPAFIRDFFYDIIARYRYKIFGKRKTDNDVC